MAVWPLTANSVFAVTDVLYSFSYTRYKYLISFSCKMGFPFQNNTKDLDPACIISKI